MSDTQRFHNLDQLDIYGAGDESVRVFTGDGSPYLRVPGCLSVERILIDGVEFPAERHDRVVARITGDGFDRETVSEPMYALAHTGDGTPVILRSKLSNDGIWQTGVRITIVGEWEAAPTSGRKPKQQAPE